MIEIITPALYDDYADELDQIFRLRCRVFQEQLGWDVSAVNGRERDQFDDLGPVYLIGRDEVGAVVATVRLLPMSGPCMLNGVFRQLLDQDAPAQIEFHWEASRLAIEIRSYAARHLCIANRFTRELYAAVAELGLINGIEKILTIYDPVTERFVSRLGIRPSWRGPEIKFGKTTAVAVSFDVTPSALQAIRRSGRLTGSVLPSRPPNFSLSKPAEAA